MSDLLFDFSGEDIYYRVLLLLLVQKSDFGGVEELGLLVSPSNGYKRPVIDAIAALTRIRPCWTSPAKLSARFWPDARNRMHSSCTIPMPRIPRWPRQSGSRELLAHADYFPVNLLRRFDMDDLPYSGSYSSGCTGFMSLLIMAAGVLRAKGVKEVIGLTADLKPARDHL